MLLTTSAHSIELINPDTVSCHPIRRLEAQFDTVVISLSPSVRFNLHISRMHESFCLLKHVINPRSPCTAQLEVGFPTAKNSFPALFWTLLITLYCLVPHIPLP